MLTPWDFLTNGSMIKAGEVLMQTKTSYFFYIILLLFSVIMIYISNRSEAGIFISVLIGSILLIFYEKVPANLHFVLYTILVLSLTLYLFKVFWRNEQL